MTWWWQASLSLVFLFTSFLAEAQTGKPVQLPPNKPKEATKPLPNPAHEKKKAILLVLQSQQQNWNKGVLDGFLEAYWKSDTLRMVSNRGVTYGWEKMKAGFLKNYPDSASMGRLDYDVIHVELIGETDALVTGKWLQKVEKKFKGGYFTFLFRKLKGKWVIVADHTS
jgi:hypothetical protein